MATHEVQILVCFNFSTAGERQRTTARGARVPLSQRETEENCSVDCRRKRSVTAVICDCMFPVDSQDNELLRDERLIFTNGAYRCLLLKTSTMNR